MNGNNRFHVDLDELDEIVTHLAKLEKMISDHLTTIDVRVKQLHSAPWEGLAAAAHLEAHREWIAAAKQFHEGVGEMRAAARHAHTCYTTAKSANCRMLG